MLKLSSLVIIKLLMKSAVSVDGPVAFIWDLLAVLYPRIATTAQHRSRGGSPLGDAALSPWYVVRNNPCFFSSKCRF